MPKFACSVPVEHDCVNYLPTGKFYMLFLLSADFFQNQLFLKNSFRNTIRVSNTLDLNQARHFVGPDPVPTLCKVYQQMTLVGNEYTRESLMITCSLFGVGNGSLLTGCWPYAV